MAVFSKLRSKSSIEEAMSFIEVWLTWNGWICGCVLMWYWINTHIVIVTSKLITSFWLNSAGTMIAWYRNMAIEYVSKEMQMFFATCTFDSYHLLQDHDYFLC